MHQKYTVTGMTCSACSAAVEKSVRKLPGIEKADVNLLSNSLSVTYDPAQTDDNRVIQAVIDAGYGASVTGQAGSAAKGAAVQDPVKENLRQMRIRLIVSLAFWIPLMYLAMYHMFKMWFGLPVPEFMHMAFAGAENAGAYIFTQFLLVLPIVYINRNYFAHGFKTLVKRSPNMDSLIAIGSTAAILYGIYAMYRIVYALGMGDAATVNLFLEDIYIESAGTILTLITVGKYLEARSKGKTSEAIAKLMDLAPKTATVERDGAELEVPIEEVRVGDIVIVRPGKSIPVDGVITEGSTAIDQSALTGESIPVEKAVGDHVIGASINKTGFFKVRAEKVGSDTTLAQIINLVEEANTSKASIAKMADKISGIFVPIVIGIAILSVVVWLLLGHSFEFALSIGIAVLVISCPCALGLATPVAIMVGTGKGATNGILFKSAEALENAHSIQTVVLDKTGTITEGKPKVTDIVLAGATSETELLRVAAALEKPSEHPLSEAIVERAASDGLVVESIDSFTAIPGRGIQGELNGSTYYAGNLALMQEQKVDTDPLLAQAEELSDQAKTPLYFAKGSQLLGLIAVADTVKPTSAEAIRSFKAMGIDVVMLTGDNQKTAAAIQKQLGIDTVVAEVLPQDKDREVRRIQESGRKVAMIGDGINDAPALARADVGIAIGAGTDIAIESADIVLMKSDLLDAVTTIQLSKATIRNIKQNLFWAFFYNTIGIPLAAGVFYSLFGWKLNPMFAAATMSISSVFVVGNALRLRFFKPKRVHAAVNSGNLSLSTPLPASGQDTIIQKETTVATTERSNDIMEKIVNIEGMSCGHCKAHVEKELNALPGVQATVELENNRAIVKGDADNATLTHAVEEAGYKVTSIE
ncbi:MAG: heavy metal translocating P-type ATPase [Oscillospiraceae bacterium]